MELVFAALPIGFLIFVMTKKKGMPSTVAFALAALLTYTIRIAFFKTNVNLAHAAILSGLLQALTPISIVFGATFFFVALQRSGAMQTDALVRRCFAQSNRPVAKHGVDLAEDKASIAGLRTPGSQSTNGPQHPEGATLHRSDVLRALTPLTSTVGILLATRIPFLGLRQFLTFEAGSISIPFGKLGVFSRSPSLLSFSSCGESLAKTFTNRTPFCLFRPSFRFFVAAVVALMLYRCPLNVFLAVAGETFTRPEESGNRSVRGPDFCSAAED